MNLRYNLNLIIKKVNPISKDFNNKIFNNFYIIKTILPPLSNYSKRFLGIYGAA